jgi:hypothetical protein
MKTACPDCHAAVIRRVNLERPGDPPLFAETYACGAVRVWGLVDAGNLAPRCCQPAGPGPVQPVAVDPDWEEP